MRPLSLLICLIISPILVCSIRGAVYSQTNSEKKDPVLIYREAGADAEQEAKIRQLAQEYDKEGRVRMERLRNLSKQMREMSFEPELDEKKVLALQDEINDLQNNLSKDRIKLMLAIRSMLTPEQRTKLVELLKEKENQRGTSMKLPSETKLPAEPGATKTN